MAYLSPCEVLVEPGPAGAEAVEESGGGGTVRRTEPSAPAQRAVPRLSATELLGERVYLCGYTARL